MRQVSIDYSNTQNLINNLRSILRNLDNEKREVNSALRELYDLENYYYNKGEIVQELEYRQRKISKDIESTEELIDNISRFLNEVKETDGNLANKFKQDIKTYAKKNNIDLVSDFERFLNKLQTGLDIVGCLPVIGDIADAINGAISLARGDIGTALISFIAVVPFVGDAAKGLKYLDKASDLLKLGDKAVDIGKATTKTAIGKSIKNIKKEAIGLLNKGENAVKGFLEATMNIGKDEYVLFLKKKPDVRVNLVTDGINSKGQAIAVGGCLTGDTLVVTDRGYKQIREVSVGELVLSKNEESGIAEYKKVTEIHKNSTYKSCRIKTKNSIIEATTGHLFMIKDKWWTAAVNIKEKDFIETSNNKYEEVVEVEFENRDYPIITYNLNVEDNHTYYIEADRILTHNMGKKNPCFDEFSKPIGRLNMAGKTHPISGVKFDDDGFPLFKSEHDMYLEPGDYLKSRGTHFDRASKSLYKDIKNNPVLASKFTKKEIEIFKAGGVPKRFTWHHNQEPGLMQLVDRIIHRKTGHDGGFSIWGPGNK